MALLAIEKLEVVYGKVRGTSDVGFTVDEGEIVALIGANGAGKSSTLKAILGLAGYATGRIAFRGRDLAREKTSEVILRGIAYSPEGRRVFPQLTVQENLRVGAHVLPAADVDGRMSQIFDYFPRLRQLSRQMAGSLSGGEQQMLAIGRALMSKPALFLLDEPSLGLAPLIVGQIGDILLDIRAREGLSVVLAEQNANWALEVADRGVIMELGRTVKTGAASRLIADPAVRNAFLGIE